MAYKKLNLIRFIHDVCDVEIWIFPIIGLNLPIFEPERGVIKDVKCPGCLCPKMGRLSCPSGPRRFGVPRHDRYELPGPNLVPQVGQVNGPMKKSPLQEGRSVLC